MDLTTISALAFVVVAIAAIGFQLALAAGAPWGAYAMGGRFPGRFPPPLRVAAVVQAVVVADRAGLLTLPLAPWLIWVPAASVMLAASLVVALVG